MINLGPNNGSSGQHTKSKESLTVDYFNRNKQQSKVMGHQINQQEQHGQGFYKAAMNRGTSKVNWDEVANNKAKIAEYKERMLG